MTNRFKKILNIRQKLSKGGYSIGSWMQIPNTSIAEVMGHAGYDWIAIDMEHGAIGAHQLPDLFRSIELGDSLPLARLAQGHPKDCKQALDAGAGGVIIPMVESAEQLIIIRDACRWPPSGSRGVGFSRANLFGRNFESYKKEAQSPLFIVMIESILAVENLDSILSVEGIDAVFIGPYDLSASMNLMGEFENSKFIEVMTKIKITSDQKNIPCGVHIIEPSESEMSKKIDSGYRFIAYSMDSVFLNKSVLNPLR